MTNGVKTTFTLERRLDTGAGTFGRLFNESGDELIRIVERPWKENANKISCIPTGKYQLGFYPAGKKFYPRYRKMFAKQGNERGMIIIEDVPCRTHILIHKGNYPHNSWGCLLTNLSVGRNDNGELQGYRSADAYRKIYPIIADAIDEGYTYLEVVNKF